MTFKEFVKSTNYSYMPQGLKDTLSLAAEAYKIKNGVEPTIDVITHNGDGGASWGLDGSDYKLHVYTGSGGIYPVQSIDGKPTFAQYDNMVGLVHEPGHILLNLLGVGTSVNDHDERDEINIAVLALAVSTANGDLEKLIRMMLGTEAGWSETEKIAMADSWTASYENYYNNLNRDFSGMTGLSENPDVTRTGYVVDREWKTGKNSNYQNLRRQNLIINGDDVSLLGNQLSNKIYSGIGNDYIDGGAGNDYLYGEGYDFSTYLLKGET